MANEIEENIYLVNAPAGSGKTTKIKEMIIEHTIHYPEDNILCITYTNRAVDELKRNINNKHIFISTIHSFINTLVSPLFGLNSIKDLYWEIFGERIQDRINNLNNDPKIEESNKKYVEKHGGLSVPILKANIDRISYGETKFSSLYYGKLSHEDLLIFARIMMDRYPNVRKKISDKYQLIFIDEYQDTSSDVLNIFYRAIKDTDTTLFFLGDKMQQIYKTYDGSFESTFSKFNTEVSLGTNHRSIPVIVDILNKLYNNPKYKQEVYEKNKGKRPEYNPRIILSNDIHKDIGINLKDYPDTLVLYVFNKERFQEIGAVSLWDIYSKMEQYSFGKKYSAVNVLTDTSEDNPDEMMKFLFRMNEMSEYWKSRQYGNLIFKCKKYKKYFNTDVNSFTMHTDKLRIKNLWRGAFEIFNDSTKNIGEFMKYLTDNRIIVESCFNKINHNHEYDDIFRVPVMEIQSLYKYLKEPHISTQHGVKGESHDTVVFVAAESFNEPIVHMYKFFKVWAETDFSLNEFENFYYSYAKFVSNVQSTIGIKTSILNKELHKKYKDYLIQQSKEIISEFEYSKLFEKVAKNIYDDYLEKPNVNNARKCFKDSTVYGVLSAYRLFYVGCSRARKNLTIIVDESKLSNFKNEFIKKAYIVGFDVIL